MEKDDTAIGIEPKNMFVPITVTQLVCIAVLLIAILIIKFGFTKSFAKVQDFCKNNVLEPTRITADFDGETGSEI